MKSKQYYSTHEFAKLIGVTSQTLRNWEKAGKLVPHHRGGGGGNYRFYSREQLYEIIAPESVKVSLAYIYSQNKYEANIRREILTEYMQLKRVPFSIFEDCGLMRPEFPDNRTGLREIIKKIINEHVDVIVLYDDQTLPVGFGKTLSDIAAQRDTKIEIAKRDSRQFY